MSHSSGFSSMHGGHIWYYGKALHTLFQIIVIGIPTDVNSCLCLVRLITSVLFSIPAISLSKIHLLTPAIEITPRSVIGLWSCDIIF